MSDDAVIRTEYRGRVAVITIDNERRLNALTYNQFYNLAQALREVAMHDEVYITVLLAKGRYFSAGAAFSKPTHPPLTGASLHKDRLTNFAANNLNITHAFATHPKVLVIGLNGPVMGLSASLVAFGDFIYAAPHTFILTPFSTIGLAAEGGASLAMVERLGRAKSYEALIMSRRVTAEEMLACGFLNAIFDSRPGDDIGFHKRVLEEVDGRLGDHIDGDSLVKIKHLINRPRMDIMHTQNVHEVFSGLDRFMTGVPLNEFRKIARGEKKYKL